MFILESARPTHVGHETSRRRRASDRAPDPVSGFAPIAHNAESGDGERRRRPVRGRVLLDRLNAGKRPGELSEDVAKAGEILLAIGKRSAAGDLRSCGVCAVTISRREALRIAGASLVGLPVARLAAACRSEPRIDAHGTTAADARHDTLSRLLARFVVNTQFDELPTAIVEAWKTIVLDSIAIGLVGSQDRLARAMGDVARRLGGVAECTVINSTHRTDAARAAWLNGTMIGTPQSDSPSHAHAASNVVPAIMAVAERDHLDGKAFLAALILGGEVGGRIERASVDVETKRGFHNPGVQGPFSAAAAVGRLLRLDEDAIVNALGIAGSSSAGLQEFAFEGGDLKATHAGRAAQLGLESALLAAAGVRGPSTVLEGPFGYFNGFSLPTDPRQVAANLTVSSLSAPGHKPYAVHSNHQQIVDTILRFKADHPAFNPDDVRRIVVRGPEGTTEPRHAVVEPTTVLGAKYSTPFTTAVAFCRDISDPLNYDEAAVLDLRIRGLAKRVELVTTRDAGDRANGGECEIALEMSTGTRLVLRTRAVKGSPGNPFTFDDGVAKFRQWTGRIIPADQSAELIERVRGLAAARDMADVVRATAART
jgi:2-methylcitrate dehydratase PrpD